MRHVALASTLVALVILGCPWHDPALDTAADPVAEGTTPAEGSIPTEEASMSAREAMVKYQIVGRKIEDGQVIEAMEKVPRHLFVPPEYEAEAYEDYPLPIGYGQTISQPYIVAYMTAQLGLESGQKVLEIGTGSGYQAAVLAEIVDEVFTIEIVDGLCKKAMETLVKTGYEKVHVKCGNGYAGWPEEQPFDRIILTAAPDHVPQALVEQLAVGGKMIMPIGVGFQDLILITKTSETETKTDKLLPVKFVPMTGIDKYADKGAKKTGTPTPDAPPPQPETP